ncbi:LysR family transcriptional regulator [Phenylobacterium sp. LjRoot219]|uniref:LysR substrate-binding domain-containing protein n=1 Tax=Phenylobacterium sp. LjRoot219 TaxID=3342283 RepID=UPI003ED0307C
MPELSLLNHFVAVATTGSFTKAAAEVHASQSVVSRSIKRLEEQVGALLFERTTRQVKLTPAGTAFLEEALAIVDRLAVATDNARRIGAGDRARLRIGVCASADAETSRIARGFAAFRSAWPDVEVQIVAVMRNRQAAMLRASEIDIGLMRLFRTDAEGIDWRVIACDPLVVAVPSAWNLNAPSIRLEELRDRPWLMPHPDVAPDMYQLQVELCRGAGFEPQVVAHAEDALTGKMMLACGLGASFANFSLPHHDPELRVQFLSVEGVSDHFSSQTVVAWAAGSTSVHIGAFVRCIAEAGEADDQPTA